MPPVHSGMVSFRVVQVGQIRRSKWANLDERTHLPSTSILTALEHYAAYMKATNRDERISQEVIDFLKRKGPGKEEPKKHRKKKRLAEYLASTLTPQIGHWICRKQHQNR